jgi:hypothetical protein
MTSRTGALVFVLSALLSSEPCLGQVAERQGGATPEGAVALLAKAAGAGDLDATCGLLVDEQARPIKAWFRAQADLAIVINAYSDALDKAYGADPKSPVKRVSFDLKKELAAGFEGFRVVGKPQIVDKETAGVKVQMTLKGPDGEPTTVEQTLQARKGASGWKLYFLDLARLDFPKSVEFLDSLRKSIERTTKGVKAGKFKTRDEAMTDVERDRPVTNLPGNVPMPRFLTRQD